MKYFVLIAALLGLVGQIKAWDEPMASLMKQTVDQSAPVIDSVKVLELLKQLSKVIPQSESVLGNDISNLISFTTMSPERCDREVNNVRWPSAIPSYGPNMLAYIKHYKLEVLKYCKPILESNVSSISSEDLRIVKKMASEAISGGRFTSVNQFDNFKGRYAMNGAAEYVKSIQDKDFAKKMGRSKFRDTECKKQFHHMVPHICHRFERSIKPLNFLMVAMRDDDTVDAVFQDQFFSEWLALYRTCTEIDLSSWEKFVSSYYPDGVPEDPWRDRAKDAAVHSVLGGGGPSMSSYAAATM